LKKKNEITKVEEEVKTLNKETLDLEASDEKKRRENKKKLVFKDLKKIITERGSGRLNHFNIT
jgi:hypothetical protein